MAELPESDGERVAIAGDADEGQVAVGGIRAHGDRGHTPVHRVEAVAAGEEICRGLGGAADPGELYDVLRLERQRPARLNDRGGDRVVTAARTQRGQRPFVVATRESEGVRRQRRVAYFWLGDEGHWGLRASAIRGTLLELLLRRRELGQHALDDERRGDGQAAVVQQRAQLRLLDGRLERE